VTPSRLVNFFFATVSLFRRTLLREILRGSLDIFEEDRGEPRSGAGLASDPFATWQPPEGRSGGISKGR